MQTALRIVGRALLVVGIALWFFGGMNLERTSWQPAPMSENGAEPDSTAAVPVIAGSMDFRPGPDWLVACIGGALLCFGSARWLQSRVKPKNGANKSEGDSADPF